VQSQTHRLLFISNNGQYLAWRIFLKNIQRSFDSDFKENISHIERYTNIFNDEITLAHRQRQDASSRNIERVVGSIYSENTSLNFRVESREENGKLSEAWFFILQEEK
jgi:hypothetical protein